MATKTFKKVFTNKEESMQARRDKGVPIKKLNDDYIFLDYEPYGKFFPAEEMIEFVIQPEDVIVDVTEEPLHCKIYRYVLHAGEIYNREEAPVGLDYKTGLTVSLFEVPTFEAGELTNMKWYADEARTDLIIDVSIVYNRDFLGHATNRVTTRSWVREDGTFHPDQKITTKTYDDVGKIVEIQTRRKNLVDQLKLPILSVIQQNTPLLDGETMPEFAMRIQGIGKDFLRRNKEYFTTFIEDGDLRLRSEISSSQESWMSGLMPDGVTTIKQYLLSQIDLVVPS